METLTLVTVYSDHNNLKYFMSSKSLNRRQVRWAQYLADFNFEIVHRPGRLNVCADALSRRAQDALGMGDKALQEQCLLPPELFVPIKGEHLVSVVMESRDPVHVMLAEKLHKALEDDEYYHNVRVWLDDKDPRKPFPVGSGSMRRSDADDDEDESYGRNGFFVDEDELLLYKGALYIPPVLQIMVLSSAHDSVMAGHNSTKKTLEYIRRNYWWPKMKSIVKSYIDSCIVCQRTKPIRQLPAGLLNPLPVASKRWSSVTMDFMTDLPPCQEYDAIMVVVDRFTKMAHFMPCTKSITAEQTALLYQSVVFRQHGLPENIITDRGPQFDSEFWRSLWSSLGVQVSLSTRDHPETDGQSERVNSVLNQYLRVYSNYMQDNWVGLLPSAEFAYNNAVHSATGVSPFYANTGQHPRTALLPESRSYTDDPEKLGVYIKLNTPVKDYKDGNVLLANGEILATQTLIWASGVTGQEVPGLPADVIARGRR
ncbi:MAG: hypothetical protein EOO61_14690, partial [Hymenobacter sp.]